MAIPLVISATNQNFTGFNKSFVDITQHGGKEALFTAVAAYSLRIIHNPYLIPLVGVIIGFSASHLAYKITSHYNLTFELTETSLFQQLSRLKVIALVFAFLVVGTNPYIGLALGVSVGVMMGMEVLENRKFKLLDGWMKKIWTCLR